jgi:hypothetical protein
MRLLHSARTLCYNLAASTQGYFPNSLIFLPG